MATKRGKSSHKAEVMKAKERKFKLLLLHHDTNLKGRALMRRFNTKYFPHSVNELYVKRNVTADRYASWLKGEGLTRKPGSGRRKSITDEMKPQVQKWIEDDDICLKEIPELIEKKYGVKVTERTISNTFKKQKGYGEGYFSHVTPLGTPLKDSDEGIRMTYATYGPINNWSFGDFELAAAGICLPKSWKERRLKLSFWDHKPFYLGKFHRHNARQCRFKGSKKPLKPGHKEKYAPKFMVFGLCGWQFSTCYFHCRRRRNKRKSRNADGDLILKYCFEHISVNQAELNATALTFIPILKSNGISVLIGDCDVKLHNKKLAC